MLNLNLCLYFFSFFFFIRTIILPKSKESNETPPVEVDGDNDKQKELPRRVWFKPTDKRMPLIALFGRKVPSDIVENEEYYKTHLFSVR